MTRQYLRGEVLILLSRLEGAAPCRQSAAALEPLRRRAETISLEELPQVLRDALTQAEAWCWSALDADCALFQRECQVAADLYEFGLCSGMLAPGNLEPGDTGDDPPPASPSR
jgi:hypothetical protein